MTLVERPVNLRDIGGYEGREGKTVKKMTLLRSGEITNITEKDNKICLLSTQVMKPEYNSDSIIYRL